MKISNIIKIVALVYSLAYGMLFWAAYNGDINPLLDNYAVIGFGVIALIWLLFDAKERSAKKPAWSLILTLLLPIAGVPVYLSMNKDGQLDSPGTKFFGFVILMFVAYYIGTFLV